VIVWDKKDGINVTESAGITLNQFKQYALNTINGEMELYHDNAQLIR